MIAQLSVRGEVTVITLSGRVNIEKAAHLKNICDAQIKARKLIFCLERLSFVGSSGIQNLFQMMQEMKSERGIDVKVAGLNPDFQRLWQHGAKISVEMHGTLEQAVASFRVPTSEII